MQGPPRQFKRERTLPGCQTWPKPAAPPRTPGPGILSQEGTRQPLNTPLLGAPRPGSGGTTHPPGCRSTGPRTHPEPWWVGGDKGRPGPEAGLGEPRAGKCDEPRRECPGWGRGRDPLAGAGGGRGVGTRPRPRGSPPGSGAGCGGG